LIDLLERDELELLFNLYYVEKAKPIKKKSTSICFMQNIKRDDLKKNPSQILKDNFECYDARNIIPPKIYELGSNIKKQKKQNDKRLNNNTQSKQLSTKYSNAKSKLEKYITENRIKVKRNSIVYRERSQTAIHSYNSIEKENFLSKKWKKSNLPLTMDDTLKISIKNSRGPVYFAQFTTNNLQTFAGNEKKVNLTKKFYYIYEWLNGINENECQHFFDNPFVKNQETNINETLLNNNYLSIINSKADEPIYVLNNDSKSDNQSKKQLSMTHKQTEDSMPQMRQYDINGRNKTCQTYNKTNMITTKKFENNFNLKTLNENKLAFQNRIVLKKFKDLTTTADKLKYQKNRNDLLLSRMSLDLYIF
jgi:hypothetical protein